jgi:glycosyltransferase involved in cell wall biosynthesis
MRILHVVPSYLPAVRYGGPIFAVHGLCQALAARGHLVEVFTTNVDGPNDSAVPIGSPVGLDGVHVKYFPSRILRRIYWSPPLARAVGADMARFAVVHLHSVFLWPTWVAARLATKARVPYVVSPRGMLVKELIERRNRLIKLSWLKLVEKKNLERASAIHVTSALEAAELKRFGWRLPRIVEIPNGVDKIKEFGDKEISADIKEIAAEQPMILFLGRISWKKGLDRLLHAFSLTHLGRLAVVGPDDEKMAPRLAQLAEDLHIADRVRFLPRPVHGPDKEYLYRSAKVFVLSSYSENFGNTVLEAMQRGVPVVVTPEVGMAQIVRESGGGLVVAGDAEQLGAAICRLIADPGLARSIGEAGTQYSNANYTWDQIAARMEQLYSALQGRDDRPVFRKRRH